MIVEKTKDLFTVPNDYYLVHCISADFGMGRGIVVEFNKRFNMKNILQQKYPNYLKRYIDENIIGDCILEGRVFNLITKERYYHKPTYKTLTVAVRKLKDMCIENNITKLAMPLIGCGLDRLDWSIVSALLKTIFKDTNIDIVVCRKEH